MTASRPEIGDLLGGLWMDGHLEGNVNMAAAPHAAAPRPSGPSHADSLGTAGKNSKPICFPNGAPNVAHVCTLCGQWNRPRKKNNKLQETPRRSATHGQSSAAGPRGRNQKKRIGVCVHSAARKKSARGDAARTKMARKLLKLALEDADFLLAGAGRGCGISWLVSSNRKASFFTI